MAQDYTGMAIGVFELESECICFVALDAAAEDLARVQSLSLVSRPLEGDFVYNRTAADGPVDRLLRGFVRMGKCGANVAKYGEIFVLFP